MPTVITNPARRNPLISQGLDAAKAYTGCPPNSSSEENLYGQSNSADCKRLIVEGRVSTPVRRAKLENSISAKVALVTAGQLPPARPRNH